MRGFLKLELWEARRLRNIDFVSTVTLAGWMFAQELTDMALAANKTAPIFGLIQTAWGGT